MKTKRRISSRLSLKRLIDLRAYLRKKKNNFDYSIYVSNNHNVYDWLTARDTEWLVTDCGTHACVAGWCCIMNRLPVSYRKSFAEVAGEWLGLTVEEENFLFFGGAGFGFKHEFPSDMSYQDAAKRLGAIIRHRRKAVQKLDARRTQNVKS